MAKQTIEVNVRKKTLKVGKRELKLEDNFEGAGVFVIPNAPTEILLELSYRKEENFSPYDPGKKICTFLNFFKKSKVQSSSERDYSTEVFPAVKIVGEYNVKIYND